MRGRPEEQTSMIMLMTLESRVPQDHPIRRIRKMADEALKALSPLFDEMYGENGRPSVPPERLLKATLLMALYSVRSERHFCEQLDYNLLFRWFLDMTMEEASFVPTVFTKNRERLLSHEVGARFLQEVVLQARNARLMSADHFSVDGTLIEAWASIKSFRPKDDDDDKGDGNGWGDFRGEKRNNETHESKTDPESKLMRKGAGKEAKLSFSGHALMENRSGLLVDLIIEQANGTAERDVALQMIEHLGGTRRITVGADKGYDTRDFVSACRDLGATPHVAQNATAHRSSAIDARTAKKPGYVTSQRIRKRIESIFGWMKTTANFRRTRFRGIARTQLAAHFVACAYNLLRMARLTGAPA